MIKRYAIKKIMVSTLGLILLLMFYFFPTKEELNSEIIKDNSSKQIVYLLDDDNYVSQVVTYFDTNSIEDNIKKKIDILKTSNNGFYHQLNNNIKLNSVKVDKDKVYLDFSSELLNINDYVKEYMIESITYSLTEINGINDIYITVNNNRVDFIEYPLNRNYGINKEYNINNLDHLNKTTVFFSKTKDDINYYVPVTKVSNLSSDKIDIIIYELKSSINSQNNLNSYINDNLKLVNYNIEYNQMNLIFNNYIFNNDKILESVSYEISSSIFENYDVNEITFNTEDEKNVLSVVKQNIPKKTCKLNKSVVYFIK